MNERAKAEEHLRIIRSLMERATVYRAISAPAALLAGLLALAVGGGAARWAPEQSSAATTWFWLGVLAVTAVVNVWSLWRDAVRRGDPFWSSGMRLALRALLPGFLVAGVCTLIFFRSTALLVPIWAICYGVALLATGHFAPQSINRLGWAFLVVGLGVFAWQRSESAPAFAPNLFMAAIFGGLHVIYALCTWTRRTSVHAPLPA